jgi:hypothetical protein
MVSRLTVQINSPLLADQKPSPSGANSLAMAVVLPPRANTPAIHYERGRERERERECDRDRERERRGTLRPRSGEVAAAAAE